MNDLVMKNPLAGHAIAIANADAPAAHRGEGGGGLSIRGVEKRYGPVHALAGITLEVAEGSFVALLGPSGCGKTTLLNAIAGFIEIDAGSIEIAGQVLTGSTPPHQRNLGMVFQHYALFPHMTVRRNIAFPLEIRRIPAPELARQVDRALEMVDLAGLQDRFPSELSGGQQQRVALARALVYSPPVLLLDEPLGALDRHLRDVMQAELKDLHQRLGKTFVYVTHDQDEALAMADVVVVMRDGRIEQAGPPLELYEQPANAFVARFVGECNILSGAWQVAGSTLQLVEPATGAVLHERESTDEPVSRSVAIRPEWIQLQAAGRAWEDGLAHVPCKVVRTRFQGSESILDVASPLGDLHVRVSHAQRRSLDLHDRLELAWAPRQTVLLQEAA